MAGFLTFIRRRCRTRSVCVCLMVFIFCYTVINMLSYTGKSPDHITVFPERIFREKKEKKILIWTPFLSDTILKEEQKCLSVCESKCVATDDKSDIADSDAVNFHLSNLWPEVWKIGTKATIRFPTYRRPDQVWILSNMEPPHHLWGDLKVFNGLFNWTFWYRSDATILWPYGAAHPLKKTEIAKVTETLKGRNFHREKKFEIFGRISNCLDPGRRYRTIRDLQKYLDIDMFGLCYDRPCGNPHDQWDKSCEQLMRKYKFYVAFENGQCKDYITEKYWWAPERDQIPIVNWKNINPYLPLPHSYINIYDFKDLKSFAEYVKKVSANETLYNSYFDWKKTHKNYVKCPSCKICNALHNREIPAQVMSDLDGWVSDDTCDTAGILNDVAKHVHSWLFWNIGI